MGKTLFHPLTLVFAVAGLGAVLIGQAALGVLALLGAVASAAYQAMLQTRELRNEGPLSDLGNEDRARLAPLRRLRGEISALVQERGDDPSMSVIGTEALKEADHLLEQCAKMLQARRDLKKASASRVLAEKELSSLEASASGGQASDATNAAIQARRTEIAHYGGAEASLARIEESLRQAEATLSELKARLAASGSQAAAEGPSSELEETLGRMRSLGASLDEAEEWLKGQG